MITARSAAPPSGGEDGVDHVVDRRLHVPVVAECLHECDVAGPSRADAADDQPRARPLDHARLAKAAQLPAEERQRACGALVHAALMADDLGLKLGPE